MVSGVAQAMASYETPAPPESAHTCDNCEKLKPKSAFSASRLAHRWNQGLVCVTCETDLAKEKADETFECNTCLELKPKSAFSTSRLDHRSNQDLVCITCETDLAKEKAEEIFECNTCKERGEACRAENGNNIRMQHLWRIETTNMLFRVHVQAPHRHWPEDAVRGLH